MKNYFLDTSFLLDLLKENKEAVKIHEEVKGEEVTGTPCLYELCKFAQFNVLDLLKNNQVLKFRRKDAEKAGKIYQDLKQRGKLIGEIDIVISGMVKNHDLTLITRDQDFAKVEDLNLRSY